MVEKHRRRLATLAAQLLPRPTAANEDGLRPAERRPESGTIPPFMDALRPALRGQRHMTSSGHSLASMASFRILENGGNAVDAGVAAGIVSGVVMPDMVHFGGVAPIIIRMAKTGEVVTLPGLGRWPKLATLETCRNTWGPEQKSVPLGIGRQVVPSAPAAWIEALIRYGTKSFGEVAKEGTRCASEGFPIYPLLGFDLKRLEKQFRLFPTTAKALGYPEESGYQKVGEIMKQPDLGKTMQYMADMEAECLAKGGSREEGLRAARAAFYEGKIAEQISDYHEKNGGWLRMEDFKAFKVDPTPAVSRNLFGATIHACGPWCQGPFMLQILALMDSGCNGEDLRKMGHNSAEYLHLFLEAVKLAAADREQFYADPDFISTPMQELLAPKYTEARRGLIDPNRAAGPEQFLAGNPLEPIAAIGKEQPFLENIIPIVKEGGGKANVVPTMPMVADRHGGGLLPAPTAARPEVFSADLKEDEEQEPGMGEGLKARSDTTYLCVVDEEGNAFSATPSDNMSQGPVVPGTGICPSTRGSQSRLDPNHKAAIAPGKRPRLTPNPAIAVWPDGRVMPFGCPGGDVQCVAMAQVFMNVAVFGMNPQAAIEAPRVASYALVNSFAPHDFHPYLCRLESRIPQETVEGLRAKGHRVEFWRGGDFDWEACAMCAIHRGTDGIMTAGADPRWACYAAGW